MNGLKNKYIFVLLLTLLIFNTTAANVNAFGEGSKGPDVFAAQGMLKSLGYYPGKIDGVYGPQMKAGVTYFQQVYGLTQTGAINGPTLQSILWAYSELKIPKKPIPIKPPAKEPDIQGLREDESQMVSLVNQERSKAGLSPLSLDIELTKVARVKSRDMIEQDYFSHQSPIYGSPFEMMKKFNISYSTAGENIACNQNVEKAHQALMESPGHRENILKKSFTHVGIGIENGGACGKMFTQMFIGK